MSEPYADARPALSVDNLRLSIQSTKGKVEAVADLTFSVAPGKTLAIVGESGCGKSLTALSLMKLLPSSITQDGGDIVLDGRSVVGLSDRAMASLRGSSIAMIFQDPMTSLNPLVTIGQQVSEAVSIHQNVPRTELQARALELLTLVGVSDPRSRLQQFPHELSGGMRQRVMIASAMACNPRVLIADEPTTALDVTVQAQILALLKELQSKYGTALVLITHDFGVVAQMADEVAVMYSGRIVEKGPVKEIFALPSHPYTRDLIACSRHGGSKAARVRTGKKLPQIPGTVMPLVDRHIGCNFQPRCSDAISICSQQDPHLEPVGSAHLVECWNCCHAGEEHQGEAKQ